MSALTGFKVSRQRQRTNTSSLRTNGDGDHVLEAMKLSIQTSNSKARRTMKRKRSTSEVEEAVPCEDDEATCEEKQPTFKEKKREKKKRKEKKRKKRQEPKSSSSDENVLTAKKVAKHNKELYDVLSSSIPHQSSKASAKKPTTIDEYDAEKTRDNMEAFNQFIINQGTLMEKVSQEDAQKSVESQTKIFEHVTFNQNTYSWYEFMQSLREKTCFDPTPIDDDQSARTTTSSRKKKSLASSSSSSSKGDDKKTGDKQLPVVPVNYKTSMTAAFSCDVGKIVQHLMSMEPYWTRMYNETQRRAMNENAKYDLSDAHECPRDHVNRMLVTPYGNFNECANGQNCKARVIYHLEQGLIGYRSPSEFEELASKPMSSVPLCRRLCYICHLALVHETLLHQQNRGASCMTVNTPFMHLANKVGEYHQRHMIPHSIRTGDADVQTPMIEVPKAGTQNSGGLVVPVRMWVRSEYVRSTSKPVRYLDEEGRLREETRPGLEEIVERFTQHDTNKPPVPPVNPYIYTRFLIEHRYDTWDILRYGFATNVSREEFLELSSRPRVRSRGSIGVARLKERMKDPDEVIILPIYWALSVLGSVDLSKFLRDNTLRPLTEEMRYYNVGHPNILNGMEQFPFHAIFHKDLRYTAKHVEDILAGGRILLEYLGQRPVLNFPTQVYIPLWVYRDQLELMEASDCPHQGEREVELANFYRHRRLYLAYRLRDEVIRTLRVVYPNSTTYNDPCFHGRFEIVDQWNREHYGALFANGAPLDSEIAEETLNEICAQPVPFRYFASDVDFIRVRTEIVERENPRKELGEFYSMGCGDDESVADVYECSLAFAPFDDLRARFASQSIARSVTLKVIDRQQLTETLFPEFPESMLTTRFAELSTKYAIALAVSFRISLAQKIYAYEKERLVFLNNHKESVEHAFLSMNTPRDSLHSVVRLIDESKSRMNQLSSFIYSHFALLERAHLYGLCSDEQFYQRVESPNDNAFLTHYEDVEPFDTVTVHEGDLPDLSYLVTCVNFVVNTKEGSKGNEQIQPVLLSVFRKMYPKCCQSRNAPDKHISACENNVSYLDLVRSAYRMTMMGGYKHIEQAPSLETALNIYTNTSLDGYDREEFLDQQRRYPHFFLLCMTEMLMFFTRQAPAYHEFILLNYPTYARYEHSVLHKADLVRRMYSEMSMEQIETFISGLEIFINDEPSSSARSEFHVFRPVRVDPIKKLVGHIQNINNVRHRQGYHRPEMPHLLQRAVIQTAYSVQPNRDIDLVQLMLKMNQFYEGDTPPPDWKRNVKRCTTYIIPWVLDMMECAEADEVIETGLNYIPPTDWEIFDLLINTLAVHYSVNVLRLPSHIRRQQEEALRNRFDIEEIGPDAGSIWFAMCCQTKTSYDTTCDITSPHIFFGQSKACHKVYANHEVCARRRRAIIERKINRNNKGQYTRIQNVMSLGDAKEIMRVCKELANRPPEWQRHKRYRYQPECGDEPIARYFPLAGHVVQYTNVQGITEAYSVCTRCGATAGFSRRLFDINGFSCISCEEAVVAKLNTPRCVACCCFIDIHTGQGEGTGRAKWKRFVVFNDSLNVATYRYEVQYVCANNGCYDLQTAKLNGHRVFSDRFAISTTTDLQKGRKASAWKSELEIRMGMTNVHENIRYFYENMALPNNRRGSRRSVPRKSIIKQMVKKT